MQIVKLLVIIVILFVGVSFPCDAPRGVYGNRECMPSWAIDGNSIPRSKTNSRFATYSGIGVNPEIAEKDAKNKITRQDANNWDNRIEDEWVGRCIGGRYVSHILVQYANFLPNGSADFTLLTPKERGQMQQCFRSKSPTAFLIIPGATQLHSLNRTPGRTVLGIILQFGTVTPLAIGIGSEMRRNNELSMRNNTFDHDTFNRHDSNASNLHTLSTVMFCTAGGFYAINIISGIVIRNKGGNNTNIQTQRASSDFELSPYFDLNSQSNGIKLSLNF